MSMSEESHSTNEEPGRSKEELQSLNEELTRVNAQLQDKLEELVNATNDMANLMAGVDTAILVLSADQTIQRFTPSATRLFDLIDTDLGRPLNDITIRCEDPDLAPDIDLVLKHLTPIERAVRGEQAQWYLRRITPYRTADNRIDGVVLTFTDITAAKRAELELRDMAQSLEQRVVERSKQLQEEQTFNDTVLDTVASLILVVDSEGRVVQFNQACEAVTGYHVAELKGTSDWWQLVPADEVEQVRDVVDRLMSGVEFVANENHWLTRDGDRRLLSWRNTVLRNAAGQVEYIVASGLDITEQRTAEEAARHHLEEASRLQRLHTANELATLLAHELNQPLAAITMSADAGQQLLQRSPLQPDKLAELLAQISQQTLRAGEIIRRLRTFVGRGRIEPVPLDLNAVVRRACVLIEPKARSAGIDLHLDLDQALPRVMGDDVHIEQVLLNLMRNAVEAIRDAGMHGGTVSVHTQRVEDMAQVSVRDSGPGVDAETAAGLFENLVSDKEYGLGVGLRISCSLIEAHGGRLWAEPQTPGGIFHFVLHLAP
jgi:PAS domain S-box-containing protein